MVGDGWVKAFSRKLPILTARDCCHCCINSVSQWRAFTAYTMGLSGLPWHMKHELCNLRNQIFLFCGKPRSNPLCELFIRRVNLSCGSSFERELTTKPLSSVTAFLFFYFVLRCAAECVRQGISPIWVHSPSDVCTCLVFFLTQTNKRQNKNKKTNKTIRQQLIQKTKEKEFEIIVLCGDTIGLLTNNDSRNRPTTQHIQLLLIVVIDRFHIALFSALEQTNCAHLARDSEWVTTSFYWAIF